MSSGQDLCVAATGQTLTPSSGTAEWSVPANKIKILKNPQAQELISSSRDDDFRPRKATQAGLEDDPGCGPCRYDETITFSKKRVKWILGESTNFQPKQRAWPQKDLTSYPYPIEGISPSPSFSPRFLSIKSDGVITTQQTLCRH